MKQSVILWTGSLIVVFLFGYLQRLTSPYYPISATVGIDGKAVTYSFDKVYRGTGDYQVIISSEIEDLSGVLQWKNNEENEWRESPFKSKDYILSAKIPHQKPFSKIYYRALLNYKSKQYYLPTRRSVQIEFLNEVPAQILGYYYFFLYGGLILAIRTGLETFKPKNRIKMYSIFSAIFFFVFAFAFTPIKRIYEAANIGTIVLPITYVFQWWPVALFLLWVLIMILVFNLKKKKNITLIGSVISLILFLMQDFV
jgi:hypothetical protein